MPRIIVEGFIHQTKFAFDAEPKYSFYSSKVNTEFTYPLCPHTISFDLPESAFEAAREEHIKGLTVLIADLESKNDKNYAEIARLTAVKLAAIAQIEGSLT